MARSTWDHMSEPGGPATQRTSGRRSFVDRLLGLSALGTVGAIVYPVLKFVFPPPRPKGRAQGAVLAARASELAADSGKVFALGTRPAILVHTPDGKWRAFSARCTHLSCTVRYRQDLHMIFCPCHDGRFDLTGKNVGGPPPRPLPEHTVVVKGDEVYVTEAEVG
jgi:cytochrome b6-f complex iron-sulfur subunit